MCNTALEGSAERKRSLTQLTPTTCLRKYVIHVMVGMQFGVSKYSQIFNAASACSRGFIQFVMKTGQLGFSRGNNSGLVGVELRGVSNAPSAKTIYIRLK